jgi:C4-dicarboxylate transporter, DcuC family
MSTKRKREKMDRRLLGILVAITSLTCIAFQVIEPRLGLLAGAMVMFLIAGDPSLWFRRFVEMMGKIEFLKVILPVFAFASVAKATGCTTAFVNVFAEPLSGGGTLLVPVAVLVAFLTNMALVSASASGLVVGVVFLPILIAAKIDPGLAVASVLAGTWGAVLSPGSKHAALIAEAANLSDSGEKGAGRVEAMDVVRGHARVVIPMLAALMGLMWLEGTVRPGTPVTIASPAPPSLGGMTWLRALVPLIPLVLLWILPQIRSERIKGWFPRDFLVFQTMLLGIILAFIVGTTIPSATRQKPSPPETQASSTAGRASDATPALPKDSPPEVRVSTTPTPAPTATPADRQPPPGENLAKAIFEGDGMANGYGGVMTMIISAMVFVAGLDTLGVLDGFLSWLKGRRRSVAWFAFFGDMGFAALSGSGDAASCSFNGGVTPSAKELGERPRELGSMAWLGAEMGRCISPFAAVTIALASNKFWYVQPMKVVSWTVVPIILAGLVGVLLRRIIKD